jgi:hypothetical protein
MSCESDTICLWDGVPRSRAELASQSPALLHYWEEHPVLEEVVVAPTNVVWGRGVALVAGLVGLSALTMTAALVAAAVDWRLALGTLLVVAMVLLGTHLLGSVSNRLKFPRSLRVENGTIVLVRPASLTSFSLREVYWYRGFVNHDSSLWGLRDTRCIILRRRGHSDGIACGMSEELFSVWASFLSISGVPESRPCMRRGLLVVGIGALCGLAIAWAVATYIGPLIQPRNLALALVFYVWMAVPAVGGIYGSVVAGNDWFRMERLQSSLAMFGVFSSIAVLPAQMGNVGNPFALVVWMVLSGVFGCLVAWHCSTFGRDATGSRDSG